MTERAQQNDGVYALVDSSQRSHPAAISRAASGLGAVLRWHREVMNREKTLRVDPAMLGNETGLRGEPAEILDRIFVRVLGVDGLAGAEVELVIPDSHALRDTAHEMHLDAPRIRVVVRAVLESRDIQVAAELAIDAREHVEIESGGDAL